MRIPAKRRRLGLAGGAVFLSAMTCAPFAPAEQAAATAEPSGTLEDIIVPAEKRSESLGKVPLSIVAFTSESPAELGVQDFNTLAARIPGVTLNSAGPGRSSYSIRGVASVGGNAPTTGLYVDETPILPSGGDGATASIDPDLYDLAPLDVLRRPQGTLYGASSMGGTVRLITNQPNLTKTEGAVKVEGSDTQHGGANVRVDAMYNMPLLDDPPAFPIARPYTHFTSFP